LYFSIQSTGAGIVLWQGLPLYRYLMVGVPEAVPQNPLTLWALLAVTLFQASFWPARAVPPVVGRTARPFLAHLILFAGRMTFVYVGGLFAVVFYVRHAELRFAPWRETLLLAVLFSMFCYTLELERIGRALLEPGAIPGAGGPGKS